MLILSIRKISNFKKNYLLIKEHARFTCSPVAKKEHVKIERESMLSKKEHDLCISGKVYLIVLIVVKKSTEVKT